MKKYFEIHYLPLSISLISLEQAEFPSFLGLILRGAIGQSLLKLDKEASVFLYRNGEGTNTDTKQVVVKSYMIIQPERCIPKT